jgi:hypothetical protein
VIYRIIEGPDKATQEPIQGKSLDMLTRQPQWAKVAARASFGARILQPRTDGSGNLKKPSFLLVML